MRSILWSKWNIRENISFINDVKIFKISSQFYIELFTDAFICVIYNWTVLHFKQPRACFRKDILFVIIIFFSFFIKSSTPTNFTFFSFSLLYFEVILSEQKLSFIILCFHWPDWLILSYNQESRFFLHVLECSRTQMAAEGTRQFSPRYILWAQQNCV